MPSDNGAYANAIAKGQQASAFIRLLFIWQGSLYKLVFTDLLIYLLIYYTINFVYRFGLNASQRETFEEVVSYCEAQRKGIPIDFLLGFFVAGIIARWYQMFMYIPNITYMAFRSQFSIVGRSREASREIRVCAMRYVNLAWILAMRTISDNVKNRFRTLKNYDVEEKSVREILENINKDKKVQLYFQKLVTENEIKAMEKIGEEFRKHNEGKYEPEYWVPLQWCTRLIEKAYIQGYIYDPRTLMNQLKDVDDVREKLLTLLTFSSISIPLVYTQVVIIAVYTYFMLQLISSQFVQPIQLANSTKIKSENVDLGFPIFTIIHFLFLLGWLKVAICVFNPFGDDDQDFPTSNILDGNLEITKRIASAENDMYPDHLHPANIECRVQPGAERDNLPELIEDIQNDLLNMPVVNTSYDMTRYEMQNTTCGRFRSFFPCLSDGGSFKEGRFADKEKSSMTSTPYNKIEMHQVS